MTFPDVPGSVAGDYGLEDNQVLIPLPPVTSRDILTPTEDYRDGTELGGVAGPVQPPPHVPTGHERIMQIYAIDPADDGSTPESVLPPEFEGDFRTRPR